MFRNVFMKNLHDQRRSLIWWGIGVGAYAFVITLLYPTIRDAGTLADEWAEAMPKELASLFFQEGVSMGSPEGFFNAELFSFMAPLFFLIFAISFASGTIAGEEGRGNLDILLTNPITRRKVVLEKFAAMILGNLLLASVFLGVLFLGVVFVEVNLDFMKLAAAVVSTTLLGLVFGGLALTLGCASGSRGLSIGVSGGLAAATYLLYALGPNVDFLESWYKISPFYASLGNFPLLNGLELTHMGVLLAWTISAIPIAIYTFERRDLSV